MKIVVNDEAGKVLLEAEAIYLDGLIAQAQEGVNVEDSSGLESWVPTFKALIKEKYQADLDDTTCYLVALETVSKIQELKKSLNKTQTSQQPTVSTHSS